jgi:hypothetical protein
MRSGSPPKERAVCLANWTAAQTSSTIVGTRAAGYRVYVATNTIAPASERRLASGANCHASPADHTPPLINTATGRSSVSRDLSGGGETTSTQLRARVPYRRVIRRFDATSCCRQRRARAPYGAKRAVPMSSRITSSRRRTARTALRRPRCAATSFRAPFHACFNWLASVISQTTPEGALLPGLPRLRALASCIATATRTRRSFIAPITASACSGSRLF